MGPPGGFLWVVKDAFKRIWSIFDSELTFYRHVYACCLQFVLSTGYLFSLSLGSLKCNNISIVLAVSHAGHVG